MTNLKKQTSITLKIPKNYAISSQKSLQLQDHVMAIKKPQKFSGFEWTMVDTKGLEPLTPSTSRRCSPS